MAEEKQADANTVKVKALKYFRGEDGEGTDRQVAPDDELTISRQRAAQLFANGLIEYANAKDTPAEGEGGAAYTGASHPIDPALQEAAAQDSAQQTAGSVNVTRSSPDASSKAGGVTINDKRKPSR